MKISQRQKEQLRTLLTACIGEEVTKRLGPRKRYEMEMSERWPGQDWSGESITPVTVFFAANRIAELLEAGRVFEQIVLDISEYTTTGDERELIGPADTIRISYARVMLAVARPVWIAPPVRPVPRLSLVTRYA